MGFIFLTRKSYKYKDYTPWNSLSKIHLCSPQDNPVSLPCLVLLSLLLGLWSHITWFLTRYVLAGLYIFHNHVSNHFNFFTYFSLSFSVFTRDFSQFWFVMINWGTDVFTLNSVQSYLQDLYLSLSILKVHVMILWKLRTPLLHFGLVLTSSIFFPQHYFCLL